MKNPDPPSLSPETQALAEEQVRLVRLWHWSLLLLKEGATRYSKRLEMSVRAGQEWPYEAG